MIATGETVGLDDWIIDDTCLVCILFLLWKKTILNFICLSKIRF